MRNYDVPAKYPKPVKPKNYKGVTSDWLEFLKGLTPKQQKKEQVQKKNI